MWVTLIWFGIVKCCRRFHIGFSHQLVLIPSLDAITENHVCYDASGGNCGWTCKDLDILLYSLFGCSFHNESKCHKITFPWSITLCLCPSYFSFSWVPDIVRQEETKDNESIVGDNEPWHWEGGQREESGECLWKGPLLHVKPIWTQCQKAAATRQCRKLRAKFSLWWPSPPNVSLGRNHTRASSTKVT